MPNWIDVEDVSVREQDIVFVVGAGAAYPHYKRALLQAHPHLSDMRVRYLDSAKQLFGLQSPVVHYIFGFEDIPNIQEIALTAKMRQAQISLVKY